MMNAINYKENKGIICDFTALYKASFPKTERYPFIKHVIRKNNKSDLICYYEDDLLIGFSFSSCVNDFVELYYLAVNPNIRGKGIGSKILTYLKEHFKGKTIFLACEILDKKAKNYSERYNRISFYKKNGFIFTGFKIQEFFDKFEILLSDNNRSINIDIIRRGINVLWFEPITHLFVRKLKI